MATLTKVKIKQGTTPALEVIVDGVALQGATVYLSFNTNGGTIVKSNYHNDGDMLIEPVYDGEEQVGTSILVQFTQEETLHMRPGTARVEAGWILEDGSADKSDIGVFNVTRSLLKEVMKYGNEYTS